MSAGEDDGNRGGRSSFSPDWSREGAEPRYSDEQYYSRNRQRSGQGDSRRSGGESWQGSDDRSRWEQEQAEAEDDFADTDVSPLP